MAQGGRSNYELNLISNDLPFYVKIYTNKMSLEVGKMKLMPFEPPTEYYNDKIKSIDDQICSLLNQRKDLSNHDPGFPKKEQISAWSKNYNLYEDFLNSLFSHLLNEEMYKPVQETIGYVKHIPILKII